MTTTPAAPLSTATCLAAGRAYRNKRGAALWHGALGLGATVLHYAGHHGGQIFGCLVPMLHAPALDVGAAVLLFSGSIYVSRRPREA